MSSNPDRSGEPVEAKPFAAFLTEQASSHAELTEALQQLSLAVRETGKKGTLTYTVVMEPVKKGVNDTLAVTDKVLLKAPATDRRVAVYFPDANGNLHRDNPNQPKIEGLKVVEAPTLDADTLRSIDGKAAAAGER